MLRSFPFIGAAILSLALLGMSVEPAHAQTYWGVTIGGRSGGVSFGTLPYYYYGRPGYGYGYPGYPGYPGYSSLYRYPYGYPGYYPAPRYYPVPVQVVTPRYTEVRPVAYVAPQRPPAWLQLVLPDASAKVWIDGKQTSSTGAQRLYESPPLDQGKWYTYQVTASWNKDGKAVNEQRTVWVQGGKTEVVDFTRPAQK
jgi:uncharacterized protein (TIGR03000 family)